MNRYIFIVFVALTSLSSVAQVKLSDIVFETHFVDFGDIYLEHGIVTAKYEFTNNGAEPFVIDDIEAACGCTDARSSRDTILPGEMGVISADFDPKGMIGTVTKWVHVFSRMKDEIQINLEFKANIKSLDTRNDGAYYRGQYGYLLVDKTGFFWGNRLENEDFTDSLVLTNDGYNDITISKLLNAPSFISANNLPLTIAPGNSKALYLSVNGSKIDTVGSYNDELGLMTNDKFFKRKSIKYALNFKMDFDSWKRKERRNAAHIELNTETLYLGEIKSGAVRVEPITIKNTGKSPLVIKRIDTDCSCALLQLKQRTIAPNKQVTVNVKFDSLYKEGNQSKVLVLYTNDPSNPITSLTVKATVK